MALSGYRSPRERLVHHVQNLERLEAEKQSAADALKDGFRRAKKDGLDPATLKVVLRLRKMTSEQRKEKRALEAIYLAGLGMLEGNPLTDEARRRLDGKQEEPPAAPPAQPPEPPPASKRGGKGATPDPKTGPDSKAAPAPAAAPEPPQRSLALKEPEEARKEGGQAAAAGKRIYDNPYPAGDPCRAAWDEGWCAQRKSHGMDPPTAYQRRTPSKDGKEPKDGKGKGAGDGEEKGAA